MKGILEFRQAILTVNGESHAMVPNRANTYEEIYADFQETEEGAKEGIRYTVFLHPKQDVVVQRLEIQFNIVLPASAHFMANGYQSWSESVMMQPEDAIPRLLPVARKYMGLYGDDHIPGIPHGKGKLHSWTYTFLDWGILGHQSSIFLGSLNERTGFTLFLYDHAKGVLTVRKDMDGLHLSHSFPALDFWVGRGNAQSLFDTYFQLTEIKPPSVPSAIGWTSWYQHFTHISEEIILRNLHSFVEAKKASAVADASPSYFQIDDGWQTAVGDWLSVKKPAFGSGMRALASTIKENGCMPGLWISPFVASARSELVRKYPGWLLKNAKGKPLRVGWNPLWGGWYYALDFYQEGVREYLSGVFHTAIEKWGFELFKLDFLFAVCLAPPTGKTRGGVMWEAMEFLRQQVGDRRILACGVPLGSAFGQADYCRIGGDIHLSWKHPYLGMLGHRERVDTLAALHSTLSRWPLNGRAFHNDPDVYILREKNQKLTILQQHTVLTIHALLGNLFFTSDDLGQYTPEQKAEWEEALLLRGSRIIRVLALEQEFWEIIFEQKGAMMRALCNLSKKEKKVPLSNGGSVALMAYETLILSHSA